MFLLSFLHIRKVKETEKTEGEQKMKQIIKFTDVNVDGNGSNIDTLVQVEGRFPLTHDKSM